MTVYEIITNRIIEQLEKGVAPWQQPWTAANAPKNLITGKEYRGINLFLLSGAPYTQNYWLTFKQAQQLGGNVRKGEHGYPVAFWKFGTYEAQDAESGERETRTSVLCRYYTVFNVEQCENLRVAPAVSESQSYGETPIESAEQIVETFTNKPTIKHGASIACYSPELDYINMPDRALFRTAEEYYSTLFHELTHSTGHASRLNRSGVTDRCPFGSTNYSKEELVAEMGAAFLCGYAGIENRTIDNSVAYLDNWIRTLRGDSRLVLSAASQAQKAADYIRGYRPEQAPAPVFAPHTFKPVAMYQPAAVAMWGAA